MREGEKEGKRGRKRNDWLMGYHWLDVVMMLLTYLPCLNVGPMHYVHTFLLLFFM